MNLGADCEVPSSSYPKGRVRLATVTSRGVYPRQGGRQLLVPFAADSPQHPKDRGSPRHLPWGIASSISRPFLKPPFRIQRDPGAGAARSHVPPFIARSTASKGDFRVLRGTYILR
jgi:hypothetical protein